MNNDEFYEFEDRAYVNPTLSSGEQEAFINSLRDIQGQNNAQIAEQTYNLGTAIPSNLGGLGGGEAYFTSRYQTPQVGEMVSNLKAAAQAQALNDVLSNYQSQLQNQYKQAYRQAQKRSNARQRAYYNSLLGGGGNNGNNGGTGDELDINTNGGKTGGFWNTMLGSKVADFTNNLLSKGGQVSYNTSGNNAGIGTDAAFNMAIGGGGGDLGVWPNGKQMTEGSTYSFGGKTYRVTYKNGNRNFEVI